MPNPEPRAAITALVSKATRDQFEAHARANNRSVAQQLRHVLLDYLRRVASEPKRGEAEALSGRTATR
jgi:hypothetical protein